MWVLRRPSENNFVHCIPMGSEFTIGRIECSFTIIDDKSVSRRHASVTFTNPNGNPILTDFNSKFGSFVNGIAVKGEHVLRSGDTIKFGGAGSEFLIEQKDFSVFISKTCREADVIKALASDFGISVVVDDVGKAAYFVLNDDFTGEPDSDLVTALLLAKYIVSPSYFFQLNPQHKPQTNGSMTFSMALIQPAVVSKTYPMDCWIPQKGRLTTFRNVFEGIRRFVVLESETERVRSVLRRVGEVIGDIETKTIRPDDTINLKFNELLVHTGLLRVQVNNPTRSVSFASILTALIKCDGQLVEINTIYPLKTEEKDIKRIESESVIKPISVLIESKVVDVSEPVTVTDLDTNKINTGSIVDYDGPSLTALIPMPVNFLRPVNSVISPSVKTKFVKCHPKHRQPGTIPALIGPDQLQLCQAVAAAALPVTSTTNRRRLGLDPWLNEDDFFEDSRQKSKVTAGSGQRKLVTTDENVSLPNEPTITNNPKPIATEVPESTINPVQTTTTNTITSKFQSSFFKNLTKGK